MDPARMPVGRHVLAELTGVDPAVLDDAEAVRSALVTALRAAGAQVRQVVTERFVPHGLTVVAVLAESHASVHTWPEHGAAHVDVFTCGDADPARAVDLLAAALGAGAVARRTLPRGAAPTVVEEPLAPGLVRRWELGAVRYAATTAHQRVLVADTAHGVTLFCDDERQSAEASQLVYHEALVVPALLLADRVGRVLVVGSSEGVACELAVAAGATLVDHVDIDRECVRACAAHLPYGYTPATLAAAERHDGPVHLHYADGAAFVAECAERYDVVVVDLPDERPGEPAAQVNRLYSTGFLARCAGLLTPGGVVVSQAGAPAVWRAAPLRAALRRFEEVFAQVVPYVCDEHEWAFLLGRCAAGPDPAGEMVAALDRLPRRPETLDATALRARTVLPHGIRTGG